MSNIKQFFTSAFTDSNGVLVVKDPTLSTKMDLQSTAALQTTANTKLDGISTKLDPLSTAALQTSANTKLDTIATKQDSQATATLQTSANTKLDTISGKLDPLATAALQTTGNTKLDALLAKFITDSNGKLFVRDSQIVQLLTGIVLAAGSNNIGKVSPADDQDPIFDTILGTKSSVTASATVITPPTGCKYVRIISDIDIYVNTDGNSAVDSNGTSVQIIARSPENIPVKAGVAVKAYSPSGTATVRCMPFKVR